MAKMTMHERMLAVCKGQPHDRVPFAQYENLAGPNEEIWDLVGRENMGILHRVHLAHIHTPNCSYETEDFQRGEHRALRTTLHTPKGDLVEEKVFEEAYNSAAKTKHFIMDRDDYEPFLAYLRDMTMVEDAQPYIDYAKRLGDQGLVLVRIYATPYQRLWRDWVSLENLAYHMLDYPDLLDEVLGLLGKLLRDEIAIVGKVAGEIDLPLARFADNLTAPAIGEANFRKYCMPYYQDLANLLEGRNVPIFSHMDGDLKPLWGPITECALNGIESYTPTPTGDTSVQDVARLWPDRIMLLNFPSSVHIEDPGVVRQCTDEILDVLGHSGKLQIQISENVPSWAWPKSFPQIVAAIEDFGPPGG